MLLNLAILLLTCATGAVLMLPRLRHAAIWRATITPLASIIGSGFLVLGPILQASYGWLAPVVMAGLCAVAWAFGAAIRYSMATGGEATTNRSHLESLLDRAAGWALAGAYVISVAYYLNLFGAFAVSLLPNGSPTLGRIVTTGVFALILGVGWTRGFRLLERMEYASVTLKLAIIAALLLGLGVHFAVLAPSGGLYLPIPQLGPWAGVTLAFGLIVTVQGFETTRYMAAEYDLPTRLHAMRLAQGVAAAIYMVYVIFMVFTLRGPGGDLSETAIIDMLVVVTPLLPWLLVAAALSAQFSAAVADTGGSGGLVADLTGGRVSERQGYAVLVAAGLAITWALDVFQIISVASRAFAAYYALQAFIAALRARRRSRGRLALAFAALGLLGVAIAVLGAPVEG